MSDDSQLSVRIPNALDEALSNLAEHRETSRSEIAREHLIDMVIDEQDQLPDHVVRKIERERRKSHNSLTWQRIHFRSNVADKFRRAFEQGDLGGEGPLGDRAAEDLRSIYVEEARGLFLDEDRTEEAIEFVRAVANHAKKAADETEFNALDPEEMFARYSGVEEAQEREEIIEGAIEKIREGFRDPDALTRRVSAEYRISKPEAREAVDRAFERIGAEESDD